MNASVHFSGSDMTVMGELNFVTVISLWNESLPLLKNQDELHIDLAKVTSANSAALALLLEWLKYAKSVNKPVFFQNVPASILSIAAVSGVDKVLNF